MKELNINGQVIEIDPAKFYILELNANEIEPGHVDNFREELAAAGVQAGFILGTPSGQAIKIHGVENPFEGGDEDRRTTRVNARNLLIEAHNNMQQAVRAFISAEAEVLEALEAEQPATQGAAFSALFVAMERAYDEAEAPLNDDQAGQARRES